MDKLPQEAAELRTGMASQTPKLYANGFTVMLNNGDVVVVLKLNGVVIGVLNTSYTVAKTLSISLQEGIEQLESLTGNTIMSSNLIGDKMRGASE